MVDFSFKYLTYLGDGLFAFLIVIVFLFISLKNSMYILISYLSAAAVSSYLKQIAYHNVNRPSFAFFYYVKKEFNKIDGVDCLDLNSFPSGHALSAFALFFCLIFMNKNHIIKTGCFILALLAAYSRVHLFQHWLIDIYVGSIIGTLSAILFYVVIYKNRKLQFLDLSLSEYTSIRKNKHV